MLQYTYLLPEDPRDMLITSASTRTQSLNPATTFAIDPEPCLNTLTLCRGDPFKTPTTPNSLLRAATVPATWVPAHDICIQKYCMNSQGLLVHLLGTHTASSINTQTMNRFQITSKHIYIP